VVWLTKRKQLNIKLDGELLARMRELAESLGITVSELARVAVGEYLLKRTAKGEDQNALGKD
jgi:antitoxin component of RelBE/YafQ-DinJ toxin-antitoxin module